MSFMQPFTFHGQYAYVDTHRGCYVVPMDVCGSADPENLAQYAPEGIGPIDASDIEEVSLREGWYGRMSAPGYLDASDWECADTEEELIASLEENYGPFDDEDDEDD